MTIKELSDELSEYEEKFEKGVKEYRKLEKQKNEIES